MTSWENLFGIFVLGQACFLLGLSIVIFIYYATHKHKHQVHIALMSASFLLLTFLVAFAVNFRIFYEGDTRVIGIGLTCAAFLMADYGLIRMWHRRNA